jgi:RNA 2',3'-cyclic 3'-phosphodiesterase
METKRLFIAISLPDEVISKLTHYLEPYKHHHALKKAAWCEPRNLHITTHFLGNVPIEKIPEIKTILSTEITKFQQFTLIFDQIHFFPSQRKPHMIWASFQEHEKFSELVETLRLALETEEEPHKPIAHITLVRLKHILVKEKIYFHPIELPDLQVVACELMESELTPKGPIYTSLGKYALCTDSPS